MQQQLATSHHSETFDVLCLPHTGSVQHGLKDHAVAVVLSTCVLYCNYQLCGDSRKHQTGAQAYTVYLHTSGLLVSLILLYLLKGH